MAKYVRARYTLDRRAAASAVAGKVLRPHGPAGYFDKLPASLASTGVSLARWNARIERMHARYKQCLDADNRPLGPQLAAWRRKMMLAIAAANESRSAMVAAIANPALRAAQDWRYSSFTLTPLRSQGRKFICISNAAMQQLYALAKEMAFSEILAAANGGPAASHTLAEINAAQRLFRDGIDSFFNRGTKDIIREGKRWRRKEDGKLVPASHKVGRRLHGKGKKKKTAKRQIEAVQRVGLNMRKWRLASVVRTDGVQLHIVFRTRTWPTTEQGRPVPERQLQPEHRTATEDLDPPRLAGPPATPDSTHP